MALIVLPVTLVTLACSSDDAKTTPTGTGGFSATGGSVASTGGAVISSGGSVASGGTLGAPGGQNGAGGAGPASGGGGSSSGGTTSSGGSIATGGTMASGGTASSGGTTSSGGAPASGCNAASNETPFGCKFAWGTNEPPGALSSLSYLDFVSRWIGYEIAKDGSFKACDGCTWLSGVATTSLVPVYYAYFIGYFGHANGLPDGNENPNGPNLTTDAALLIRKERAALVGAYGEYARRSHEAWPAKPLVWLLEGDFVQYAGTSQKQALSYAELGQLAADIACAIKSNMPNAVVAINQSTWNGDQVTNDFWNAMKAANVAYDLVWTTGVANNDGFFEAGANPGIYNHATATYRYVHGLTGRPLFVDTSFGLSAMADSWSSASAQVLNARIADGVVAANVAKPDGAYGSRVSALRPALDAVCR